jgi:ABC-type multidrug transport system fused ATPase/permease subunit
MNYDSILVLDRGKVLESGSPLELLQSESSFREMVRENGPQFEAKMLALAQSKF